MSAPHASPVNLGGIPNRIRAIERLLHWEYRVVGERQTKVPIDPSTGDSIDATRPANWMTFGDAVQALRPGIGLGVALNGDGLIVVDIDTCIDHAGMVTPEAQDVVDRAGSYAEFSPSGKGIHIFVCGALPPEGRRRGPYEIYSHGRFMTLTGNQVPGTPATIAENQVFIDWFHARHIARRHSVPPAPPPSVSLTTSDEDVLTKAFAARNGLALERLLAGDLSEHGNDRSAGDLAATSMVAFWTQDEGQIERIISASPLGARDKWQKRADYRSRTIAKALQRSDFYTPPAPRPAPPQPIAAAAEDPCAPIRDELAELRRENATLRRENTALRKQAKTAEHYQGLWMATARVLRNPNLRPGEKMAGLSLIIEVEDAGRAGRIDADGWVEVPLGRISERAGCAAGTAGKHVDTLASAGVIETETKPIPGKRHARRVARFPVPATADGPTPTLTDRFAALANAAPERTDGGWGGDRRCRDHPHAGTITTTTTVVTCAEPGCGQIIGTPVTRRRPTRAIVDQDARLSDVETSETHDPDPIVNENVRHTTTTFCSAPCAPIVMQDARLSARPSDQPDPWADPGAIVAQDARLSPPPRPGGILEHARTSRPGARP